MVHPLRAGGHPFATLTRHRNGRAFKGKFDEGWNVMRERVFENQKRLGVIPANAQLTPWPITAASGSAFRRREAALRPPGGGYAAYMAYSDAEIGRVIQAIGDLGELDNTLIILVTGDNGASAEGQAERDADDRPSLTESRCRWSASCR